MAKWRRLTPTRSPSCSRSDHHREQPSKQPRQTTPRTRLRTGDHRIVATTIALGPQQVVAEPESDTTNGVDESQLRRVALQLAAQIRQVHVDDMGVTNPIRTPYLLQQMHPRADLGRLAAELLEERELDPGDRHVVASDAQFLATEVDLERPDPNHRGSHWIPASVQLTGPAQQRLAPGSEFVGRDRQRDGVIGASPQGPDPVALGVRWSEPDKVTIGGCSERVEQRSARGPIQSEIDQDHVRSERSSQHESGRFLVRGAHGESAIAQTRRRHTTQQPVADGEQHSGCKLCIGLGHGCLFAVSVADLVVLDVPVLVDTLVSARCSHSSSRFLTVLSVNIETPGQDRQDVSRYGEVMTVHDDLRAAVLAREPVDERERVSIAAFVAQMDQLEDPFSEAADPVHVTSSAIVVGVRGVVLHLHKRLGIWLQPGGHIDPGELPWDAAAREVLEETGLAARHPNDVPELVHIDVHPGPRGHTHLDLRYLLLAPDLDPAPPPGESQDVRWFDWSEAIAISDAGLTGALAAIRVRFAH